jgi:glycosyltransferase involved in cell wall biosynthesis
LDLVYCITTYNRLEYLKAHVTSWNKYRDSKYGWTLILLDDGSTDGTIEYIQNLDIDKVNIIKRFNNRRGTHYQVNQALRLCSELEYNIGFMAEDDIYFIKSGWECQYAVAIATSGFDYLCYFNREWATNHGRASIVKPKVELTSVNLQSEVSAYDSFGCLWSFTKRVIDKVGFFDCNNFGVWGNGHTDYSLRCCRAGFNRGPNLYDFLNSDEYIRMVDSNYTQSLIDQNIGKISNYGIPNLYHKGKSLDEVTRIYVKYNEPKFNMLGDVIE